VSITRTPYSCVLLWKSFAAKNASEREALPPLRICVLVSQESVSGSCAVSVSPDAAVNASLVWKNSFIVAT